MSAFALDRGDGPPRVGVLLNPSGGCEPQQLQIEAWAGAHGLETADLGTSAAPSGDAAGCQLVIALGGDGTILRALQLAMWQHAAVLGVNFGHVGFLADVGRADLAAALEAVTDGDAVVDERTALVAEFQTEEPHRVVAFNDVVVTRVPGYGNARLRIGVGDDPLLELSGDGVVVASPTGSTAYTVGAGGPAVVPSLDAIVLTPLASQGSPLRSLVVDGSDTVRIETAESSAPLSVEIDGRTIDGLPTSAALEIHAAPRKARLSARAGGRSTATSRRRSPHARHRIRAHPSPSSRLGRSEMRKPFLAALAVALAALAAGAPAQAAAPPLWKVYDNALKGAKYVDLTHTITPTIPVWSGFGPASFAPATNPATGQPYTYAANGFEATRYLLQTDQLGTQLDPPAHWAPEYAAIDELPATFAVRPLVVISIVRQLRSDDNYALQVNDIRAWERRYGKIPRGSVVMVRSDWSDRWPDPALATLERFPGVGLDALKFLHRKRHILFHGHEPLDTDSTPTLEGEHWLMHHGYAQAEGVANLDEVPPKGALINIGYPKFGGGLGGYARYVAICPPGWKHGVSVGEVPEAPLQRYSDVLRYDAAAGMRIR